jgi:alkylation response protein AidB-like acyl-CoA dehydrogenase
MTVVDSASATTTNDPQLAAVEAALERLLAEHDPRQVDDRAFRGARYDAGLAWVHFPEGFGGLGVRPELNRLVEERCRRAGAAAQDPSTFFIALAGPTIVTHGDDEQKRRFLRPMFTGEERWCQLFSEPGAGSDFAGLGTRAVRDGDEWVVNGQKVWNTLAHLGDWGMLVARTDPEQPKHKGMTYFALDMRAAGVEVRPLRQITGEAEFNEVYMTDVRVPDEHRIGDVGEGWRVSLTTLMNERSAIGGGGGGARRKGPVDEAIAIWKGLDADQRTGARRDRLVQLWCTVDLLGADGMVGFDYTFRRPEQLSVDGMEHGVRHSFLRARANSIEGGTSEIMRNILGEQVLGLPGEPRVDKELPWSKVPRS